MYIRRHGEETLHKLSKMFGAVLITGARQVGKSTLLTEISQVQSSVTLDDPLLKQSAREQAATFFKDNPPPVMVDEIQYAPNLLPYIKMYLDKAKEKGQFYLTGSL